MSTQEPKSTNVSSGDKSPADIAATGDDRGAVRDGKVGGKDEKGRGR
jgi:hypothetical protein